MVRHDQKENKLIIEWDGATPTDLHILQWDLLELLKLQTDTNFTDHYRKHNGYSTWFYTFDFLQKTLIDFDDDVVLERLGLQKIEA